MNAALSFAITGAGVALGATNPFQPITSKPGSPACATGEIPGTSAEGCFDVTASPRTVPPVICDCAIEAITNDICVAPEITALSAEFASRNGTCTMSMPAMVLNNSPARCGGVPMPDEA